MHAPLEHGTYRLELVLQIAKLAGAVVRVFDILMRDLQVATGAFQDEVDHVGYGSRFVLAKSLEPLTGDIIERLASSEYLSCEGVLAAVSGRYVESETDRRDHQLPQQPPHLHPLPSSCGLSFRQP